MRAEFLILPLALAVAGRLAADAYPRQQSVRPEHYRFRIALRDDSNEISAETTVRMRFLVSGPGSFRLDLADTMTVEGVSGAATFRHSGGRIELEPAAPVVAGDVREFSVRYHGLPAPGLFIGRNRHGGRAFFGLNWPDRARTWLAVIDHPSAKATCEFLVTAPSRYQVVANGLPVEQRELRGGVRESHWSESVPIAPWLYTIGVAEFARRDLGQTSGVPLQTWVFPEDREPGNSTLDGPLRRSVAFFSDYIGPFPYQKLAGVQALGFSGGIEYASAIFFSDGEISGKPADALVAHEVAHQWFGDSVTETDWDDVWLSEGFATYFALLYREHYEGRDGFLEGLRHSRGIVHDQEARLPDTAVLHTGLSDMSRVLNRLVYEKGAWVLQMLRAHLGDQRFHAGIREYYRRYRDSNASTADFRRIMEEISGEDLAWFFRQWLTRPGTPKLAGSWRYDAAGGMVELDLEQQQEGPAYRLEFYPGPARLTMTGRRQHFSWPVAEDPGTLDLDPGVQCLPEVQLARIR